jgi:hypothetical protein
MPSLHKAQIVGDGSCAGSKVSLLEDTDNPEERPKEMDMYDGGSEEIANSIGAGIQNNASALKKQPISPMTESDWNMDNPETSCRKREMVSSIVRVSVSRSRQDWWTHRPWEIEGKTGHIEICDIYVQTHVPQKHEAKKNYIGHCTKQQQPRTVHRRARPNELRPHRRACQVRGSSCFQNNRDTISKG